MFGCNKLATKLVERYGRNFAERNIYRMMQFAEHFPESEILSPLATKLSWSHFIELLPLKTEEARLYYAHDAAQRGYGTKELRRQISRKAYERREIANSELSESSIVPFNERKIREILIQAQERLARRKMLTSSDVKSNVEYFYKTKDDDAE